MEDGNFRPPTESTPLNRSPKKLSIGIDAVHLIICMFFDFAILALKRLFRPSKLFFWGIWPPKWWGISTTKAHILVQKYVTWRTDRQNRSTGATCARDEETKKRQRQKPDSGKLAIRRDHPLRRIEMKSCMAGGLQMLVLSFEFHQNRFISGFGAVVVEICPSPFTWPLAYTTACTTVQAVNRNMWQVTCSPRPPTLSQSHVDLHVWCATAAAIGMGRKKGAGVPLSRGGSWVPVWHNVAWAGVYFLTKWHLHPSSRLATTIDMDRKLGAVARLAGRGSWDPI